MTMRRVRLLSFFLLALVASACKETGSVIVRSIDFRGVRNVDANRLKSVLATRESTEVPLLGWQLPWVRKNYFERGRFDADLQRIEAFYADRGFPQAKVTDADVRFSAGRGSVDVTLTIDEGPPVRVVDVRLEGFDVVPAPDLERLRTRLPLVVGAPRDRQVVTNAHEVAVNELREHGYPFSKVSTTEDDGADGLNATITFVADPGPLTHFGAIEIVGNRSVGTNVIERQLTFKPGDLYRRSVVQDSQRRLYGMELFLFVNIEIVEPQPQGPSVNMRVTVAEGKHQRVNFGVGYGTDEKGRVQGDYRHVNFLGGARSAGIRARWSSLDRGARMTVIQPFFLVPHVSLTGEGQRWNTVTPAYTSVVTGGRLTMLHRETSRLSWSISASSERNASTIKPEVLNDPKLYADLIALGLDPTTGSQEGTLSSLGFDFQQNSTDAPLNATRGTQLGIHVEEAGRLLPGTFNYSAFTIDGRHYLPVGQKVVIANRIQLGTINARGSDPSQVPFAKKYFLGGATSIRGWGPYQVSPLGGSGLPIGGNSLLQFSSEVRLSLSQQLGGALFLDGGNVWAGDGQFVPRDLRYAVGLGIRYGTPIGPIRVDYGYQVNPIPGLVVNGQVNPRRWRIHFSIGQAF